MSEKEQKQAVSVKANWNLIQKGLAYVLNRFNVSEHVQKYLINTGWLFAERIFRMFVNVVVGIYVARYLGNFDFGILSYALTIVGLLQPFAGLGVHGILVRDIVNHPEQRPTYMGTAFILRLLGGLLASAILLFVVTQLKEQYYWITLVIGLGIILQSFQVFDLYFQARVMAKYTVYCQTVSLLISSAIKLYLVFSQADLFYFAAVISLESLLLYAGLVYFYLRHGEPLSMLRFDRSIAKRLLRESWPLILSGFLITIYMRIDQVMIEYMLGEAALGDYSAATRISESYYFLPVILCNSIFPAIINGKRLGEIEYNKRLQNLYYLLTWVSVSFAILVTIFADEIAYICYKDKFNNVGQVLAWHVWAGLFVFWGTASGKWLTIERVQIFDTVNTVIGCAINILLNFWLIPSMGIVGAAIATITAYFFAGFFCYGFFKKTRPPFMLVLKSFNLFTLFNTLKNASKA